MPPRPDPKDYRFGDQKGATLVKKPGDVNGLQFIVEDLVDCTVHVLDYSDSTSVDYCTGSTIVLGPVDGSCFIRNCSDCTFYVACRQFRTREVTNCKIFLYSHTQPIIELSHGIEIAPWNVAYPNQVRCR